jgi:hypothetical protein
MNPWQGARFVAELMLPRGKSQYRMPHLHWLEAMQSAQFMHLSATFSLN